MPPHYCKEKLRPLQTKLLNIEIQFMPVVLFIDRMVSNCLRPYYTKGHEICLALPRTKSANLLNELAKEVDAFFFVTHLRLLTSDYWFILDSCNDSLLETYVSIRWQQEAFHVHYLHPAPSAQLQAAIDHWTAAK